MILIQHGGGDSVNILKATSMWHQEFCRRHNIIYQYQIETLKDHPRPSWIKLEVIQKALDEAKEGEILIWMDADTLIVTQENEFEGILEPEYNIGMVKYHNNDLGEFYHTGFLMLRNCEEVRSVIKECLTPGDGYTNPHEIIRFNYLVRDLKSLKTLDGRYNCPVEVNRAPKKGFEFKYPLVVKGWHGHPKKAVPDYIDRELRAWR